VRNNCDKQAQEILLIRAKSVFTGLARAHPGKSSIDAR